MIFHIAGFFRFDLVGNCLRDWLSKPPAPHLSQACCGLRKTPAAERCHTQRRIQSRCHGANPCETPPSITHMQPMVLVYRNIRNQPKTGWCCSGKWWCALSSGTMVPWFLFCLGYNIPMKMRIKCHVWGWMTTTNIVTWPWQRHWMNLATSCGYRDNHRGNHHTSLSD